MNFKDIFTNVILGREKAPCAVCGKETEFVEINYECHICSTECLNKMDEDYFKALEESEENNKWKTSGF